MQPSTTPVPSANNNIMPISDKLFLNSSTMQGPDTKKAPPAGDAFFVLPIVCSALSLCG